MRIVGGIYKGRVLTSPPGLGTRPTSDKARQAVFNILEHASWLTRPALQDAHVLDVFAGTGAMGLEALSRGAADAAFIEKTPAAIAACTENIEKMGLQDSCHLLRLDTLKPTPRPLHLQPRTLVFLDPPYGKAMGVAALKALAEKEWLKEGAICVLEMAKKQPEATPAGFTQQDERGYGIALVRFMTWDGG